MNDIRRKPNEEEVFGVARAISSKAQRDQYLDQICANDPVMRRTVDELLKIYDQDRGWLESPHPDLAATASEIDRGIVGSQFGPYKILELIGEGGMGIVFMAEQVSPVHRQVALKVIRSGMDSKAVIARFDAERQALALMDHPNIARFHDAGISESGSPYFVMELVNGRPIVQFCHQHKLTQNDKLELFTQVCRGVQHAHQKGVIHRDLKPSNVLVARYDELPVAKVIDFGVAKAIGDKLTDRTMFTRFGQLVGTLEYMAPEQAQLNQLDVDTRSDVYSLGAILYELLTGEPPFEKQKLSDAALEERLRIIREDEPSKPSTRLSSLSASNLRNGSEPGPGSRKKNLTIPSDLDWIVMKCLEKDRARRYATTNDFIQDIQNFLNNQPVSAGPPSAGYKFGKFVSRHRTTMIVATVVMASLLIATSISIGYAIQARSALTKANLEHGEKTLALKRADDERIRATNNFEYAIKSLKDFLAEFGNVNLSKTPGAERQRQMVLRKAATYFANLMQRNRGHSDLRREYADAIYQLGAVSVTLADDHLAEKCFQECISVRNEPGQLI